MKTPLRAPNTGTIQIDQRASLENRTERMVFVIVRNMIPIVGILFLGWSAQDIIILYFVDTLGGMWALFTALALYFTGNEAPPTLFGRLNSYFAGLLAGAFLVVFMAIPLGMPLWILLQITDWSWQDSVASTDFIYGLLLIGALSLVGMLRHYQHMRQVDNEQSDERHEFGILMTRWVIILIVIYFLGFLIAPIAAYLLVIVYAGATVASELYPERFEKLLGPDKYKQSPTPKKRKK
jgi:hypothetical protein